jgi:mRNA degradation ribonuclease J1/J2
MESNYYILHFLVYFVSYESSRSLKWNWNTISFDLTNSHFHIIETLLEINKELDRKLIGSKQSLHFFIIDTRDFLPNLLRVCLIRKILRTEEQEN